MIKDSLKLFLSLINILLLCILLFWYCGPQEEYLAVVEKSAISETDFKQRLLEYRAKTGAADNGQIRRQILKNYVEELILIKRARKLGYDSDATGQQEYKSIKTQELLNLYHQNFVKNKVNVSENELRHLFTQINTRIKARHLYASSYNQADSLYAQIKTGKTFHDLAKTTFSDSVLKESGGSLGYFSVNDMDPAFEEAAYALQIGEVSKPVRTKRGFSVIRVEDKITRPILTEYEYAQQREKLSIYWKRRKMLKASRQFADSLRTALHITFNRNNLQHLYKIFTEQRKNNQTTEKQFDYAMNEDLRQSELVRSDLGSWDFNTFQKNLQYASPDQLKWVRSEENLQDFIAGLVVRSYILEQCETLGLDKSEAFKKQVSDKFDTWLLERLYDMLYQTLHIPEDSLRSHYNRHRQDLRRPSKIRLQEIVLQTEAQAREVAALLNKNHNFERLAHKYSVRRESADKGGDLGYQSAKELGTFAEKILALQPGEWLEVLQIDSQYVFLKCTDKLESELLSYEEARQDIAQTLQKRYWLRARTAKIRETRKEIYVKSYPEKLINIRYN